MAVASDLRFEVAAIRVSMCTENLEKKEKIHWRKFKKSSGEISLKLQISVPCRGQTCPEVRFFCITFEHS